MVIPGESQFTHTPDYLFQNLTRDIKIAVAEEEVSNLESRILLFILLWGLIPSPPRQA